MTRWITAALPAAALGVASTAVAEPVPTAPLSRTDRDGRPAAWGTEGSLTLEQRHLGWPDVEVGGPGFERVPPHRWNGTTCVRSR